MIPRETRPGLRKYLPAGAFLVTLVLAVSLSLIYHDFLTARARERFDARTDLVAAALQDRLNDYDMVLRGGAALFAAKDEVSRTDWRSYIGRLDIEHSYPGIQGIGFAKRIAAEDQGKLFLPFQQLESVLTRQFQGTGLGLHLCRKIVELHGGRIWVESTPGAGSRFTFAIPLAPASGRLS